MMLMWVADRATDDTQKFDILRNAGEMFLRQRDVAGASDAFGKALMLKPSDRDLAMKLAEVHIADGRLVEAEEILSTLMKKAGKDMSSAELCSLQHRMAQLAGARGDQAGHIEWLKKAFDTNRKNAEVAADLANLAEEIGDFDLAVKALRAVTLLTGPSVMTPAMAFFRQARIAVRTGDRPRAVIFAKRALQEDPRLGEAADFLRELGEKR